MTLIFRAGWPASWCRRHGPGWIWIGPFVIGNVRRWDRAEN